MTRNLPARLGRLERERSDGCTTPALPDLDAVLDRPDPTHAEQRALLAARLEQMLATVWPLAMRGDLRAADTATRLLDRQAKLFGLFPDDRQAQGEVTAADLIALIEAAPDDTDRR